MPHNISSYYNNCYNYTFSMAGERLKLMSIWLMGFINNYFAGGNLLGVHIIATVYQKRKIIR